jgi:hypothetical protein
MQLMVLILGMIAICLTVRDHYQFIVLGTVTARKRNKRHRQLCHGRRSIQANTRN